VNGLKLDAGCRDDQAGLSAAVDALAGELLPSDLPHVPLGGHHSPSADFMVQLQEYTEGFRQQMRQQLASKTAAKHL
jgi:hypothetical protein